MAREVPFPTNREELQLFQLLVHAPKIGEGVPDMAFATGVLLAPRRDRDSRDQEFLVLRGSVVRGTQGDSDQPTAVKARDRLRAKDALEPLIGGHFERLLYDVAFPNLSRAANFLCGRAENGWKVWKLDNKTMPWSVSEAYDYDETGKFELLYYETPPGVIWIPR